MQGGYKKMPFFNELAVDLNDEEHFPSIIYERTKPNPNPDLAVPCHPCNDSLDEYAKLLWDEMSNALNLE